MTLKTRPVCRNDQLTSISVNTKDGIKQNEQLAFIRAMGVKDYLEKNVSNLNDMKSDYRYYITVSEGKEASSAASPPSSHSLMHFKV